MAEPRLAFVITIFSLLWYLGAAVKVLSPQREQLCFVQTTAKLSIILFGKQILRVLLVAIESLSELFVSQCL